MRNDLPVTGLVKTEFNLCKWTILHSRQCFILLAPSFDISSWRPGSCSTAGLHLSISAGVCSTAGPRRAAAVAPQDKSENGDMIDRLYGWNNENQLRLVRLLII